MNIMKNFKTPKPFVASFIIACILISYNIPLLIVMTSDNVFTDIAALLILTTLTSLLIYLLSVNALLVRIITIPLVLVSSVFLYFILFYKLEVCAKMMNAIFDTETTGALELLSIKLILWIAIFGLLPSYLIIKLTKTIDSSKRNRIILYVMLVAVAVILKFDIWNSYTTIQPLAKDFKTNNPLLQPSYVLNRYLPFSYLYNTKAYITNSLE
jgi:lipid A ethanolaminephosphotransferase